MRTIKKMLAGAALLTLTMAAKCTDEREFTCKHVEGNGRHKVTMMTCSSAKVRVANGKLYLDEAVKCEKKVVEYDGAYSYSEYTGKSGTSFSVDAKDIVGLAGAG